MEYSVIIERARKNWFAHVPDLPGCMATGESLDEVTKNIEAAIRWHVEALREDGRDLPEPTTRVATIAVPAA